MAVARYLKVPMTIIRPSNCYGPGQLLHRGIPKAMVAGRTGRKLPLHGGGRAEKSYLHARDLGRAIHLIAEAGPTGRVFNAGPPAPTSLREVGERAVALVFAAGLGKASWWERVCQYGVISGTDGLLNKKTRAHRPTNE